MSEIGCAWRILGCARRVPYSLLQFRIDWHIRINDDNIKKNESPILVKNKSLSIIAREPHDVFHETSH